jgi:hypothetical protein
MTDDKHFLWHRRKSSVTTDALPARPRHSVAPEIARALADPNAFGPPSHRSEFLRWESEHD